MKIFNSNRYKKVSYGTLEKVLLKLKYERVESETKYRVYVNDSYDAVIALPNYTDDVILDDRHYNGVVTNIIGMGVLPNIDKFENLIDKMDNL